MGEMAELIGYHDRHSNLFYCPEHQPSMCVEPIFTWSKYGWTPLCEECGEAIHVELPDSIDLLVAAEDAYPEEVHHLAVLADLIVQEGALSDTDAVEYIKSLLGTPSDKTILQAREVSLLLTDDDPPRRQAISNLLTQLEGDQ